MCKIRNIALNHVFPDFVGILIIVTETDFQSMSESEITRLFVTSYEDNDVDSREKGVAQLYKARRNELRLMRRSTTT